MLNKVKRKRIIIRIAWLLLLTLMPFNVVKIIHHHDVPISSSSQHKTSNGHSSGADTCPICNFVLSPFIPSSIVAVTFIADVVPFEPAIYESKGVFDLSYSYGLRAPPSLV